MASNVKARRLQDFFEKAASTAPVHHTTPTHKLLIKAGQGQYGDAAYGRLE